MKKSKRFIVLAVVMLMVVSTMAIPAYATSAELLSSSDTSHIVNITGTSYTFGPKREKENTSPIYFWPRICTDPYVVVRAAGYILNSSAATPQYYTRLQDGTSVTYVICRVGTKYSIYNGIHQNSFDYAGLVFKRNNSYSSSVKLEYTWSPDSVGKYTPAL